MCELCSEDPAVRKMALQGNADMATRMRRLSSFYDNVAQGRIKPHDPKAWESIRFDMRVAAKEFLEVLL